MCTPADVVKTRVMNQPTENGRYSRSIGLSYCILIDTPVQKNKRYINSEQSLFKVKGELSFKHFVQFISFIRSRKCRQKSSRDFVFLVSEIIIRSDLFYNTIHITQVFEKRWNPKTYSLHRKITICNWSFFFFCILYTFFVQMRYNTVVLLTQVQL